MTLLKMKDCCLFEIPFALKKQVFIDLCTHSISVSSMEKRTKKKKMTEIRHFLLWQCLQGFKGILNCITEISP